METHKLIPWRPGIGATSVDGPDNYIGDHPNEWLAVPGVFNHRDAKLLERHAREALLVQDACNLSGVVFGFAKAMQDLCEHARAEGRGTDWRNHHPVAVLWASKIASLTGCEDQATFTLAWEAVTALTKE